MDPGGAGQGASAAETVTAETVTAETLTTAPCKTCFVWKVTTQDVKNDKIVPLDGLPHSHFLSQKALILNHFVVILEPFFGVIFWSFLGSFFGPLFGHLFGPLLGAILGLMALV